MIFASLSPRDNDDIKPRFQETLLLCARSLEGPKVSRAKWLPYLVVSFRNSSVSSYSWRLDTVNGS